MGVRRVTRGKDRIYSQIGYGQGRQSSSKMKIRERVMAGSIQSTRSETSQVFTRTNSSRYTFGAYYSSTTMYKIAGLDDFIRSSQGRSTERINH